MKLLTLIAVAMTLAMMGCSKKAETTQTTASPAGSGSKIAVTAESNAKTTVKHQTLCPVMTGNKIDKNVYVDYQGQRVYFCCEDCKAKFNAAPEKYMQKLIEQGITLDKSPIKAIPAAPMGSDMKHDNGSGMK